MSARDRDDERRKFHDDVRQVVEALPYDPIEVQMLADDCRLIALDETVARAARLLEDLAQKLAHAHTGRLAAERERDEARAHEACRAVQDYQQQA